MVRAGKLHLSEKENHQASSYLDEFFPVNSVQAIIILPDDRHYTLFTNCVAKSCLRHPSKKEESLKTIFPLVLYSESI